MPQSCIRAGVRCLVWAAIFSLGVGTLGSDVSLDPEYQVIARDHLPTLLYQIGNVFFPANACFDGDWDAANNRHNYDRAVEGGNRPEPWVYVHILTNDVENKTYIQYWYYYVYNDYVPFNIHNDDWELVVVVLDEDKLPVKVLCGWHGELGSMNWGSVMKAMTPYENPGLHPLIFVDAGSHAAYLSKPPVWAGQTYVTWETQATGRCMFLGAYHVDADLETEGADALDFSGDCLRWWEGSPALSDEEQYGLEVMHDWLGVTFLPAKYGVPENVVLIPLRRAGDPIVAPWRRDIWTTMDAETREY